MNRPKTISPSASGLTPQQIIQTYSSDDWEAFIEEWAEGFDPPYAQIVRIAGPGDKGRDVVAHVTDPAQRDGEWDGYQCKHYDHALRPSDVYAELGKLCVYTLDGSFTKPRRYRFVAPFGVLDVVYRASTEIRGSVVFATVIVGLVFLPLFTLGSVEGRLLRPLGLPTSSHSWRHCSSP
jgi:hypothetical protein